MTVIGREKLLKHKKKYPDSRKALEAWYNTISNIKYKTPAELKTTFQQVDFISNKNIPNLSVFNIRGGNYRLVARIDYENQFIYIIFIGTHTDYNKIKLKSFME